MTEAEETKLLIHKNALQEMLIKEENEIYYYVNRCKMSVFESSKAHWKEAMNQHKSQYEALDYAIELIKKELGEVTE
ncbi:MAG: hypothetical protein IKE94_12595 [Aeriscardovia sp.]|nr:hypothetical protein [Aeriscardovia sp.]